MTLVGKCNAENIMEKVTYTYTNIRHKLLF